MNPSVRFAVSVLVGVTLGVFSARYLTTEQSPFFTDQYGYWKNWPVAGNPASNPYTHAKFIANGQVPEHFSEVLTFYRDQDDGGGKLTEDCTYLLSIERPTARRWSISLTGNADGDPQLLTQDDVISIGRTVRVLLSAAPQQGNWLRISNAAAPRVLFRLYDGDTITAQGPNGGGSLGLPSVKRVSCS
jgi:hypothetical protein